METTILSKKNCHRAATVRQAGNPNAPVLDFKFREHEVSRNFFGSQRAHLAGDTVIDDTDTEMGKWEVLSWKYVENFEDRLYVPLTAPATARRNVRGSTYIRMRIPCKAT